LGPQKISYSCGLDSPIIGEKIDSAGESTGGFAMEISQVSSSKVVISKTPVRLAFHVIEPLVMSKGYSIQPGICCGCKTMFT